MSTVSLIKVIDSDSKKVLFECDMGESEKAYEYAADMERMGLQVEIISPTITETLCDSLGIELDQREDYEQSVFEEIDDHDGSCCATPTTNKIQ